MSNFFIILAAGKSERFNSSIPKPYVIYKGKPIVQHSIDKAKKCKKIEQLSIAHLIGEAIGRITDNRSVSSLFA